MNASYKIVLLGAFVLFAAVIGYYIISDAGGDTSPGDVKADELAAADNPDGAGDTTDTPDADTPPPTRDRTTAPPRRQRPVLQDPTDTTVLIDVPDLTEGIDLRVGPGAGEEGGAGGPDNSGTERIVAADPDGSAGSGIGRVGPGAGTSEQDPAATESGGTVESPRVGPGAGTEAGGGADDPSAAGAGGSVPPDPGPEADPDSGTGTGAEPGDPDTERRTVPPARETPRTAKRNYTVQAGDTFASIAEAEYNDESAWFEIAQANPSVDPKRLQVGQVIVLPALDAIDRDRDEAATPPAPGEDQTYTVRPGDNLSKIAKRFYNDTEAWDLIYARNRDKIGPRPDRLKVGMVLIIPQAYSGAE